MACEIIVSLPGIEPVPSALGAQSLSHWTTRKIFSWLLMTKVFNCVAGTPVKTESIAIAPPVPLQCPIRGNPCSQLYPREMILPVFGLHVNEIIPPVLLCVWLLSLNIFLRFIWVVEYNSSSFLFIYEYYSSIWMHHDLVIHFLNKSLLSYD